MRIEVICTGDEVLTGKIVNTNFSYITQKLEDVGLSVNWETTVGDDRENLLRAFQRRTGVPVLVNTSFNTRGEPMVCSPRDAIECFWTSPIDALVIGSFLLEK